MDDVDNEDERDGWESERQRKVPKRSFLCVELLPHSVRSNSTRIWIWIWTLPGRLLASELG
jgi:hypothetical protein